jgi:hypothetical protein
MTARLRIAGLRIVGLRIAGLLIAGLCLSSAAGCAAPRGTGNPATPAPTVVPVVIDPVVPGWSPVRSVKRAAVYDVPPTWTVSSEGVIIGYETDSGVRVAASGAADFGRGVCGDRNSSLATAGIKHDIGSDLVAAAESTAREWAGLAFRDDKDRLPRLAVGAPEETTTTAGRPAVVVKVTARTASRAGACKITDGVVYAAAATGFTGELGPTAILVIVADVGRPDAVAEAEIRRILSTLRPA